jgi:hypothetical protein
LSERRRARGQEHDDGKERDSRQFEPAGGVGIRIGEAHGVVAAGYDDAAENPVRP